MVARGLSTRVVADRLHLSAHAMQDHLTAIFDKTKVKG
jgi:DNA-binding NarL/FixJ family response regulator